jgi:hypothetical protein
MKKYLILLLFVCIAFSLKAQLAIINDPDGFVNVRKGKGANTAIVGKLYEGQIFALDIEDNGKDEWAPIFFENSHLLHYPNRIKTKEGYLEGYVHKSRITLVSSLPHVSSLPKNRQLTKNTLLIKNDSLEFSIKPFIAKKHIIHYAKVECRNCMPMIDKIDGKVTFGQDGGLPHTEISNIKLSINNENIDIPQDSYNDLFESGVESTNLYFGKKNMIYLYIAQNSDGAGAYSVVWIIQNRKLIGRYVDNSND